MVWQLTLGYTSARNNQNQLMDIRVIAYQVSVVFLRHSVDILMKSRGPIYKISYDLS